MELAQKKCVPCEKGTIPIKGELITTYSKKISKDWYVIDDIKIRRKFKFKDFRENIKFVNKVAELAEEEGHHPDLCIYWNILEVTLWTHAIGGLSENDFIVAAKIDRMQSRSQGEAVASKKQMLQK